MWIYMVARIMAGLTGIGVVESDEQSIINEVSAMTDDVITTVTDESQWETFEATAYTARCRGCTGITKSGVDVRHTTEYEGRTVIAVDPDVIPLGSAVEIRLADGTIIEGTAQDVGGKIVGNRIDVLHETYEAAIEFGRQDVEVRLINDMEAIE